MQIITDIDEFNTDARTAVAMGKFDGVHLGHRKLLSLIKAEKADGLRSVVFTFDPSPDEFFTGHPVPQLSTREEKRRAFEKLGIDFLVEFPLTDESAATKPEAFVRDILVDKLKASYIAAGVDVSFGDKGRGDRYLLKGLSTELGYDLKLIDKVRIDGSEVSSSRIRGEIFDGSMENAKRLLGDYYAVCGTVVKGRHLGHKIGVPTVNILPQANKLLPPYGVYKSLVRIGTDEFRGMTNIGRKPTISDNEAVTAETYIYDFDRDVYGEYIEVRLLEFMRPDMKFDSVEKLKIQMKQDIERAM